MTIETYDKATQILQEKKQLEDELRRLREKSLINFSYYIDEHIKISNKLFNLGQEFAAL
jgi:hypothetical protein